MTAVSNDPNTFVTHTMEGTRFDDHAVPVEVLPELAAYRELVVSVARELFFARNPHRKRVPKGFEDGFQLVLQSIGKGSAVTALKRVVTEPPPKTADIQLRLLEAQERDYFEEARDLITRTIGAAHDQSTPPPEFPGSALPLFNKFGSSLRDDERIVVSSPLGQRAVYDRRTRKRLVLQREKTYEDDVDVIGEVVQYDRERATFDILTDMGRVQGRLEGLSQYAIAIIQNAITAELKFRIRIVGRGAFDGADTLTRFVDVKDVSYTEDEEVKQALDVESRLRALGELAGGWFFGEGSEIPREGLDWLATILTRAIDAGLPRPFLYPTPDGGVLAEWPGHTAEVSAEFDLSARSAMLIGTHIRTHAMNEMVVNFDTDDAMDRLANFVTGFVPEGTVVR
jgi:hypothetical protein